MSTTFPPPSLFQTLTSFVAPPEVVEFWLTRINPLWTLKRPLARVVAREIAADGAVSLTLKPNRHFKGFSAGQHASVGVEIDGAFHTRSYSFASAPNRKSTLRIVVRGVAGGKVSQHLQTIPVGSVLELGPAFGSLHIPTDPERTTIMLAAGSGITPMLSLIDAELNNGCERPLHLFYWARTDEEVINRDALLSCGSSNLNVTLIETAKRGRINVEQLRDVIDLDAHIIACGPHGFVETARRLTEGKRASFQAESFSPPSHDVNAGDEGTARVTLLQSGRTIEVPRATSLLEALEANGLNPTHGCRMGICNTCSCQKSNGTARNLLDGKLHREVSQSIRICVHAAQSDLTLDL